MNHQKLVSIFRRIQSCPTAPFHEYHVKAEILSLLQACPHVSTRSDAFGNLIATYQRTEHPGRFVFGAHMDHPGFVRSPLNGGWEFLGGVPAAYLETSAPREGFGDFAMWKLPPFELEDGMITSRVCDDLVGCAAIVCLFHELERLEVKATCHGVFTRAEEVGFVGAIRLAEAWPFAGDVRFISLETSLPMVGVSMGEGPVIRVGDGVSVFDHVATGDLVAVAKEAGIPFQRALLDRGSCEATATQFYGIPSAGISVLLGNYHNCGPGMEIEPEYVELFDAKGMVSLITQVVARSGASSLSRSQTAAKFEQRITRHQVYADATASRFQV